MSAVDITLARLTLEEAKKRLAYNDKTGKTVTCKPNGNLSIGVGINLEVGLDDTEISFLTSHRLGLVENGLRSFYWYGGLDEARQSVLLDLGFNAGLAALLHFPRMLTAISHSDWARAHDELLDSDAARELPERYRPLADILLTGVV